MMNNLFEYNNGLNIQDADTNHDSIADGAELHYWNVTRGLDMDTSIEYCKIPDVDGDNITDGKEINGYRVKIITGWKSDGTPISEMRYISPTELDPLMPYANSTGVWTDTDGDGIPDVVEAMLSNTSYWRFLVVEYPLLWAQYSWAAKYYDTIKNKENETATEQWLHDQFNPLIVDHTPPILTKFTLRWEVRTTTSPPFVAVYTVVHVAVRDVGGIYSLNIYDLDSGEEYRPNKLGYTHYDLEHKFSASLLQAGVGSVTIRVYAEDYAGNSIQVQKNLSGAFGVVLNVISELWSQFWNTLVEVGKAVARGLNLIAQWVMEQLNNSLASLKEKGREFGMQVLLIAIEIANALSDVNTTNIYERAAEIGIYILKLFLLGSALSLFIIGLAYALGIILTAVPWFGFMLTGLISLAFYLAFYLLFPKEFLEVGEGIIDFGRLLLSPADVIYQISENTAGMYDLIFTAVTLSFGSVWSALTAPLEIAGVKFGISFALGIISLFGLIAMFAASKQGTLSAKEAVGAVMLAISAFTFVDTVKSTISSYKSAKNNLGLSIAVALLGGAFSAITGWLFLSALGYMHSLMR